jgi:glycosyltransferase involved in cell wall biosynthesis
MNVGVVIAHGRPSGGVRRMIKFGNSLASRGWSVEFLYLGSDAIPESCKIATRVRWDEVPSRCTDLGCLLCPGDLPLWSIAHSIKTSCRLVAMHLHFGVHNPDNETRNVLCERIYQMTTADWIRKEIGKLGVLCGLVGVGPIDEELCEVPAPRRYRIGTLAHADYGWKNSRIVSAAYWKLKEQMNQVELWSYGVRPIPDFPGRFFLAPDLKTRQLIYSSCRVWVAPSVSEGIGMTAFDAMQCRTPVVAADNRGIHEFADVSTCFIFRPSRPKEMLDAIRTLLLDWSLGEKLAQRAYEKIGEFKWQSCIDRLERALVAAGSLER